MVYEFGEFTLDTNRQQLRRGDQPQHLEPQVYAVLCHLVEHRDRLVTSQEMMKHVGRPVRDAGNAELTHQGTASSVRRRRRDPARDPDGARPRVPHARRRASSCWTSRPETTTQSRTRRHPGSRSTSAARGRRTDCLCCKRRCGRAAARETRQLAHAPRSRLEQSRVAALADGVGARPHAHPIRRARLWPVRSRRRKSPSISGCATWRRSWTPRASSGSRFWESHKGARSRSRAVRHPERGQARAVRWVRHRPALPGHDARSKSGADAVDEPDSGRLGT